MRATTALSLIAVLGVALAALVAAADPASGEVCRGTLAR